MNTKHILTIFISLLIHSIILNNGITQDYTQRNLPEEAKARIGKGSINDIDVSPDGSQIAVGCSSGAWIYDANTGAEIDLLTEYTIQADRVVFSPNGKLLAYGKYGDILVWDVATRKLLKYIKMPFQHLDTLRITEDGKSLLCKNFDGLVQLWDINTGEKTKEFYPVSWGNFDGTNESDPKLPLKDMTLHLDKNSENGIIAFVGTDAQIQLENAITGQHLKTIKDRKSMRSKMYFSPDGSMLAIHSIENIIRLWDVGTGKHLANLTEKPRDFGLFTFSHDGKTLVSQTESGDFEIWDVSTKTLRTTVSGNLERYIRAVAFPSDGKKLVGANRYGEIFIWNTNTGEELLSFSANHTNPLITLVFSDDSSKLAISYYSSPIQLWDMNPSIQLSKQIEPMKSPVTLTFSDDGDSLIGPMPLRYEKTIQNTLVKENLTGKLKHWDTHTGKPISDIPIESHQLDEVAEQERTSVAYWTHEKMAISQNGHILATVQNSKQAIAENQYSIFVWDVLHRNFHDIFRGHTKVIRTLAITPNGRMIASGSDDKTIRVWDVNTGTEMLKFASDEMLGLSFSMDGKWLASTSSRSMIRLWEMTNVKQLPPLKGENGFAMALAFSPDSKTLASGSREGIVHMWDIASAKIMYTFNGHTQWIKTLQFSPDGKILASGDADGLVYLWNVPNLK